MASTSADTPKCHAGLPRPVLQQPPLDGGQHMPASGVDATHSRPIGHDVVSPGVQSCVHKLLPSRVSQRPLWQNCG